jgi:2-amino-4-hydroxy-6-hydroxymethyldihydropteridine diphosphokinase
MGSVPDAVTVAIALGSNLGDRRAHLEAAVTQLSALLTDLRVSSLHETDPVDVPEPQPPYLNAAVVGKTTLEPRALLEALLAIERTRGRDRPSFRAPRTLDLDLILYGDRVVREPGLTVPHPQFDRRLFVLEPLTEIAPELTEPTSGLTVTELLAKVEGRGQKSERRRKK